MLSTFKFYIHLPCYFDHVGAIKTFSFVSVSRAASLGMTGECDPQNLLDLFSIFAVNLSSPNKDLRVLTLRILSYFGKMDQRLGTDEERPHKRQKTEDSGDDTIDMKYANVCPIRLSANISLIILPFYPDISLETRSWTHFLLLNQLQYPYLLAGKLLSLFPAYK